MIEGNKIQYVNEAERKADATAVIISFAFEALAKIKGASQKTGTWKRLRQS
jgi:hypothetical protein